MKKDLRAVLKVVILTISFVCATAVLFVLLANQEVCAKQKVRTVNYEASTYFDEEFIEQFDDFEFVQNDNDLNITATKTFSTAIFDEIDLVADEEETDFTIRYEIEYLSDDETILLNAYIVGEETEELTDTTVSGDDKISVLHIDGIFFFGSTSQVVSRVEDVTDYKAVVIDCSKLIFKRLVFSAYNLLIKGNITAV